MTGVQTVELPTPEDVRAFLDSVDADSIVVAHQQNRALRGIRMPEDVEACERVYSWLRRVANGEWP